MGIRSLRFEHNQDDNRDTHLCEEILAQFSGAQYWVIVISELPVISNSLIVAYRLNLLLLHSVILSKTVNAMVA